MSGEASPLHVEARGATRASARETFVLLHGFGGSSFTWRHWVPGLEALGRVLLVDLKGFGASAKPDDGRYRLRDQALLVEDLIAREEPDRLTLVGHSLGGGVALLTALALCKRKESRLSRLVIVGGPAYAQRLPPFVRLPDYPRLTRLGLRVLGPERVVRWVMRAIVRQPRAVQTEPVRAYAAALRTEDGVRAMLDSARQLVPDGLERLAREYPSIDVPTLLLWGRDDPVIPLWVGERLARDLPRARLEVLEACGHVPHEEYPEVSWQILERFLNSNSRPPTT